MANNDLIPKKSVSLELDTYARLSKLAANLRADNPGGGFVSMSAAVAVLLDAFEIIAQGRELNKSGCYEYVVGLSGEELELVDMVKVVQLAQQNTNKDK